MRGILLNGRSAQSLALGAAAEDAGGAVLRPFGVYVVALLQGLNAISHASGVISGVEDPLVGGMPGSLDGAWAALVALAGLVVAVGLLRLERWAWAATMLWVGAIMAAELLLYLRGEDPNYAVMAISVGQVCYLNLSDVQTAFAARARDAGAP